MTRVLVFRNCVVRRWCFGVIMGFGLIFQGAQAQQLSPDVSVRTDEVTVTARKRTESLQDVPSSISVLSGSTIDRRGYSRAKDFLADIPNLSIEDSAGANSINDIVVRGISSLARNIGFESGLSMYIDGVFTGRPITFNQDLVDIERIEVLRGPQGTVFGKNTIAGAISITTIQPAEDLYFKGKVTAGNLDTYRLEATANVPLSDKIFTKISAFRKKQDGIVTNLENGDEYNDEDGFGGRVQVRAEFSDALTWTISADYMQDDRQQAFPEVLEGTEPPNFPFGSNAPGNRTVRNDFIPFEDRKVWGLSNTIDWTLGNGGTITSITGFRDSWINIANDNDNSGLDLLAVDFSDDVEHVTQELRYASPGNEFIDYVVGVFYFYQDAAQTRRGIFGTELLVSPQQLFVDADGSVETESIAAFADVQVNFFEWMSLNLGIRYTHESKNLIFQQVSQAPFALPNYPVITDDYSEDAFSPTVGLSFFVSNDLTVYAKVSRGFKSGGWNADFLGAPNPPTFDPVSDPNTLQFEPEFVTSYELGTKFTTFDDRLTANIALFYADYEDLQISQFLGVLAGGVIITNAGQAEIKGVEIDFTLDLTERFRLSGGIGYNDATFKDFADCQGPGVDCDGNRLANAPDWTASVTAVYTLPLGNVGELEMSASASYRGDLFATPQNQARLKADDFWVADLRATYFSNSGTWQISAWIENLFDEDYVAGLVDDATFNSVFGTERTLVGYGKPRTYGVTVTANF